MNAEQAAQEKVWSRRKFWMVFGLLFVSQLAWLFLFGRPASTTAENAPRRTSFRMLTKTLPAGAFDTLLVTDPTLFVLPSRDSFSGAAWMNIKEMDYSPTEWTESPRWLRLQPEKLVTAFSGFVQLSRNPLMQISEKVPPFEPAPVAPTIASAAKSRVKVDGELATRIASELPALSSWQSLEPLDRSVVEVGVNEAGQVVSARLIHRSGLLAADQAALKLAGTLRFAPSPMSLVIGKVNFLWQTEPMAVTNSIPGTTEVR